MVDVLVVTPIRLYQDGLRQALEDSEGVAVVDCVAEVGAAADRLAELAPSPDVLLLDVRREEGAAALARLRAASATARVVVLGVRETDEDVVGWAELGIDGFVPTDATMPELVGVVRAAARCEAPCTPRMAAALMRRVFAAAPARRDGAANGDPHLTDREREILGLIDHGM